MFQRILVPLDGSKAAEQVFPYVIELARAFSSDVISIGVCEPEESEYGHICHVYMNNQADILKSKMGDDTATRVKSVVLSGRPAEEILSYAKENDVSLIVMASHGRSGIKPWSLGSTVDKVLHKVAVPLLIIRATEQQPQPDKTEAFIRILAPLDGSESCEVILPYIEEFMGKLKSEVILLQIIASGKHVHTIGGIDYIPFKDYDIESMKARDQKYLNKVRQKLEKTSLIKKSEIRIGDPAEEIVKCANETDSQLITLSSHLHSSIERWAYGSVTYKILQASNKSILLVPLASH